MAIVLPEIVEIEKIIAELPTSARVETLANVPCQDSSFPVYSITLGATNPAAPALGFFGGVHGIERIGTRVVLAYLKTLVRLSKWDHATQQLLEGLRIGFVPLVNPAGMYQQTRCNGRGVDLMRNAPVEAEAVSKYFLPAGQRYSARLPWYRGESGQAMEAEAQGVCEFVRKTLFSGAAAIAVDVHSGYGTRDRLWFPYAKTTRPFHHLPEMMALKEMLDATYPNHIYDIEPQSSQYMTHGDLWDYLYDEHLAKQSPSIFLPLSLEIGSWNWVKKNPRQIFSLFGVFNPMHPHRYRRALRRHLTLFDFLLRVQYSWKNWAALDAQNRRRLEQDALDLWYAKAAA